MEELKPCPFCGEPALKEVYNYCCEYWVQCSKCGMEGPVCETAKGAVRLWNTRV